MPCLSFSLVDLETMSQLLLNMDSADKRRLSGVHPGQAPSPWRCPAQGSAAGTSVDEQDVVLVDRTMNHVRVGLAGQQVLVEPLTAVLEGLRGQKQAFSPPPASCPPPLCKRSAGATTAGQWRLLTWPLMMCMKRDINSGHSRRK